MFNGNYLPVQGTGAQPANQIPESPQYVVQQVPCGPFDLTNIVHVNQAFVTQKLEAEIFTSDPVIMGMYIHEGYFLASLVKGGPEQRFKVKPTAASGLEVGKNYIIRLRENPSFNPSGPLTEEDKADFLPESAKKFAQKKKQNTKKKNSKQEQKKDAKRAKLKRLQAEEERIENERRLLEEETRILLAQEKEAAATLERTKAQRKARQAELSKKKDESKRAKQEFAKRVKAEAKEKAKETKQSPVLFSKPIKSLANNQNIEKVVQCDLSFVFHEYQMDSAVRQKFANASDRVCAKAKATNGWKKLNGDIKPASCAVRFLNKNPKTKAKTRAMIDFVSESCEFYELKIKHGTGARIFGFSIPNNQGENVLKIVPLVYAKDHLNRDEEFDTVYTRAITALVNNKSELLPNVEGLSVEDSTSTSASKSELETSASSTTSTVRKSSH